MHFSIPDTQELYADLTGTTTYTGYNIYINGSYHCCLRYKQLHALHEQLRRCCAELNIHLPASFPPKRLLPLTNSQLETRRAALEHYLQLVGQDAVISKLEYFQNFLLNAQQETAVAEGALDNYNGSGGSGDLMRHTTLEVWLANGYQLQVNCHIGDNATALLRKVCECAQLQQDMLPYFCLFLGRREAKDTLVLLRRLMDFESPYLSRLHANKPPCQILLRKSYWNPAYDLHLLQNSIALNLLFIQTVSDVEREWIITPPDVRQKLRSLQEHGLKKEYIEMARQLPLYGCLQFTATQIDYPEAQTTMALISIGNRELSMRTAKGAKIYETKFRVTRMRCWRVTAMHNTLESKDSPSNLQISFEYLMSKQSLRWITITSEQAMLMSVCLQSMVDELLNCKDSKQLYANAGQAAVAANQTNSPPLSYVSRNGRVSQQQQQQQQHTTTLSSSSSTPSFSSSNDQQTPSTTSNSTTSTSSATSSPTAPVKFLSQRRTKSQNPKISNSSSYSAVFFRNAEESVHNEAFEEIGDDDL